MPAILDFFSKEDYAFLARSQERNDMSFRVIRHMLPNQKPVNKAQFVAMSPECSLAGDGFCSEGPWLDLRLRRGNLNHHEGCARFATLSASGQMLELSRSTRGFRDWFGDGDETILNLFELDCDEDVCGFDFAANNIHLIENSVNPLVNRYFHITDIMDRYGGAFPFPPDLPILEAHAWTVAPYLRFRREGGLDKVPRVAADFEDVVEEVGERIKKHILGQGKRAKLKSKYEVIKQGTRWTMVKEIGSRARLKMYYDGIRAFVSVRERPDGRLAATVGIFDPTSLVSVPRILQTWNDEDGYGPNDDRHGGSDTIGGTSRNFGTKMSIKRMFKVTEETVRADLASYPFIKL